MLIERSTRPSHSSESDPRPISQMKTVGCAAVLDLRLDHGPQRFVLQVRELRHDVGLRV